MRLRSLPYLTLWTVHFDEEIKLYRDTLGLPVIEENPNFIMFDTEGSRLAFHRLARGPSLNRPTVELHLQVDDVDKVCSALGRKGVRIQNPPANRPWGTRMASFQDAEGYTVEIVGPLKPGEPVRRD